MWCLILIFKQWNLFIFSTFLKFHKFKRELLYIKIHFISYIFWWGSEYRTPTVSVAGSGISCSQSCCSHRHNPIMSGAGVYSLNTDFTRWLENWAIFKSPVPRNHWNNLSVTHYCMNLVKMFSVNIIFSKRLEPCVLLPSFVYLQRVLMVRITTACHFLKIVYS